MSIDLSSAFEQPIKGVPVEVKLIKDIEKANPKSLISLFARLGSVGCPSDVSSKLRKGAFQGYFIMEDGIIDFTLYCKALLSQWQPNVNLMVRVEGASFQVMNAYQLQRRVSMCTLQIQMNSNTSVKFFATDAAFTKDNPALHKVRFLRSTEIPYDWLSPEMRSRFDSNQHVSVSLQQQNERSVSTGLDSSTSTKEQLQTSKCKLCHEPLHGRCRATGQPHLTPVCVICKKEIDTRLPFCMISKVDGFRCTTDLDMAIRAGAIDGELEGNKVIVIGRETTGEPDPLLGEVAKDALLKKQARETSTDKDDDCENGSEGNPSKKKKV